MDDDFPEPRDRQDVPIWNAIEGRNWKQALKLVDKKLSKRKDEFTQAVKFYILSHYPQPSERSTAALQLQTLAKETPVADIDALWMYDVGAKDLFPASAAKWAETVGTMRLKAVQKDPKNEALVIDCFRACLHENDLDHANLIANTLTKQYPSKRHYIFWRLTLMTLLSTSTKCPDKMRDIYSKLSCQEIKKLASATQAELRASGDATLSVRTLQKPSELQLLHRIVASQGDAAEQLSYYVDPFTGTESKIAKGEWGFIRERVLLLEKTQNWDAVFTYCSSLLQGARANGKNSAKDPRGGDFVVWRALIAATENNPTKYLERAINEADAHIDLASAIDKTYQRNAQLARLELVFTGLKTGQLFAEDVQIYKFNGQDLELPTRVAAIVRYFDAFGTVPAFFNDIRALITQLSPEERVQLLRLLKEANQPVTPLTTSNITARINISKIEYLLLSQDEFLRSQNPEAFDEKNELHAASKASSLSQLRQIASDCLDQYKATLKEGKEITKALLSTDMHPADDWVVIAAMCLVKIAALNSSISGKLDIVSYMQAAAILETAWLKSKANAEMLLLQIRIYALMGAGSLALRAHQRLGLKQIQCDTLTYVLFDRISSLHPHKVAEPLGDHTLLDPSNYIEKNFRVYTRAGSTVKKNAWKSLQHENYNTVFELREVTDHLEHSMSLNMSILELRRMTRLNQPKAEIDTSNYGYSLMTTEEMSDRLDYSIYPSFEPDSAPPIESLLRLGPPVSEVRLRMLLLVDHIWMTIASNSPRPDQLEDLKKVRSLVSRAQEPEAFEKSFTTPEMILAQLSLQLSDLIALTFASASGNAVSIVQRHASDVASLLEKSSNMIDIPTSEPIFSTVLHPLYTAYEIATLTTSVMAWLSKQSLLKNTELAGTVQTIAKMSSELRAKAAARATQAKKHMDESGWLDRIETSVFGSEDADSQGNVVEAAVKRFIGEYGLESWAGELVQSWRDAVAGTSLLKA